MGWEERNGREYYYQKRRIGGRVVSEYVGAGWLADAAATLDEIARLERKEARQAIASEKARALDMDRELDQVGDLIRTFTRADLLLGGYRQHKGQWRRKREN